MKKELLKVEVATGWFRPGTGPVKPELVPYGPVPKKKKKRGRALQ